MLMRWLLANHSCKHSSDAVLFLIKPNKQINRTCLLSCPTADVPPTPPPPHSHSTRMRIITSCRSISPARSNPGLSNDPGSGRAWFWEPFDARTAQRAGPRIRTGPTWRTVRSFFVFSESSSGNRFRCQTSWSRNPTVHERGQAPGLRLPPSYPLHSPCRPSRPDIRGGPGL